MADLSKLRKLTQEVNGLVYETVSKEVNGDISYKTDDKINEACLGYFLFKNPKVAVQRAHIKKGSILPQHEHKQNEYLIIYDGKIKVTINEQEQRIYTAGQSVYFPPKTLHCVEALEDAWVIGITVPASEVYPDA